LGRGESPAFNGEDCALGVVGLGNEVATLICGPAFFDPSESGSTALGFSFVTTETFSLWTDGFPFREKKSRNPTKTAIPTTRAKVLWRKDFGLLFFVKSLLQQNYRQSQFLLVPRHIPIVTI
jgi:hypothetical protein